jgi:hypothetical protein
MYNSHEIRTLIVQYGAKKNQNNQHWVFRDDYLIFISSRAITQNI